MHPEGGLGRVWAWIQTHPNVVFPVIIIAVVVTLVLTVHHPGAGANHAAGAPATAAPATVAGGATSTTNVQIASRTYRRGQCVTWDQRPGSTVNSSVVSCSDPHLIEMVGHAVAPASGAYTVTGPTDAQWQAIEASVCAPMVVTFMGGSLDPHGRFHVGAITPTSDSWGNGDRDLWCGVETYPTNASTPEPLVPAFTGEAHGAPQDYLIDAGTCETTVGPTPGIVACSSPHDTEITGGARLFAQVTTLPADAQAWSKVVGNVCDQMATTYHGGPLPSPLQAAWVPIQPSSWAAGQRSFNCVIADFDPTGQARSLVGTAKSGGVPH